MARGKVRLDSKGVADILKSAGVRRATSAAAEAVAQNVRNQGITVVAFRGDGEIPLPVKVYLHETDRAHANVVLAHPAGEAVQAKHGALTKAAKQAGLDVRGSQ